MIRPNYTITFACYNQLDYTREFIASLDRDEVDFSRIVAVDNGSTDGTREWLPQQGFGAVVLNDRNLGCGAAWNQGALAIQSKWTVVMNNDVVCAKGWLENLLATAERLHLQIASPAMVEGELNYDLANWAEESTRTMQGYCRFGAPHAVCMAIREDVWDQIGYFMPVPKLLGYEDAVFFQRALEAKLITATVSEAWIHHYGMTTQKALKLEKKLYDYQSLGSRSLMKKYMNQSWIARKVARINRKQILKNARKFEMASFNRTIHALSLDNIREFLWR